MAAAEVTKAVNKVLDQLIKSNLDDFKTTGSFKVSYGPESEKFYMNQTEGSYESSLELLIHKIMYHEGLYQSFLDDKQLADLDKVIKEEPDCLYRPDQDEDDNYDEVQYDTLDVVYEKAIKNVFKKLRTQGFSV